MVQLFLDVLQLVFRDRILEPFYRRLMRNPARLASFADLARVFKFLYEKALGVFPLSRMSWLPPIQMLTFFVRLAHHNSVLNVTGK